VFVRNLGRRRPVDSLTAKYLQRKCSASLFPFIVCVGAQIPCVKESLSIFLHALFLKHEINYNKESMGPSWQHMRLSVLGLFFFFLIQVLTM
jgi:hypothetical protein